MTSVSDQVSASTSSTLPTFKINEPLSVITEGSDNFKVHGHKRNDSADTGIHYVDDDDGVEFQLDQRQLNKVHEELEKLNIATDVINKLEVQLDEARGQFRATQQKWSQKLEELSKKYGSVISKSRPYYETKLMERTLREKAQEAAIRFERANTLLSVAKEQVKFTQGVAEKERTEAEGEHREISQQMMEISQKIKVMEKDSSRAIKKSRFYFEQRLEFTKILEGQKSLINRLEKEVKQKKNDYTTSLKNLERISDSIHEERSLSSIKRGSRAGSPSSSAPQSNRKDYEDSGNDDSASSGNDCMSDAYASESSGPPPDPIDLRILEDDLDSIDGRSSFNEESLGNGVILLAQQLMGEEEKERNDMMHYRFRPEADVRYHTTLPEGICPLPSSSGYGSEASLSSSLEMQENSGTDSFVDTPQLSRMLRSHSQIIKEIDNGAARVQNIIHQRSVSDVQNESVV
uniref:SH3 domain-binding protein 5-like n=1 Tax=Rhabditophanes sp. KR3021 TaxID=114890 RepID=A0AC35TKQ8_9BILA